MKILITGANGAIGSDLVSFFSKDSIVYAIYRSENFVNKTINPRNVIWIKHDLSNEIKMKIKPDVIIHCAVTHEFKKKKTLNDYIASNILSTKNLIDFSSNKKNMKFFNFSTYAIYNREMIDILSVTKNISEHLIKKSKLNFINIRLPGVLTYINTDIRRPWVNSIINKIKNHKHVKILVKDSNFKSVIDTYEIFKFLKREINNKKIKNKTINLQASKAIKLSKLIEIIRKKFNSKSKIFYVKENLKKKFSQNFTKSMSIDFNTNFKVASSKEIMERYLLSIK
jgi:nucleoside-diphosphate-sugar epimerase